MRKLAAEWPGRNSVIFNGGNLINHKRIQMNEKDLTPELRELKKTVKIALLEVLNTINSFDLPYRAKIKVLSSASVATLSPHTMSMERKQALFAGEYKQSLFDLENMDRIKNPVEKAAIYRD